MFRWILEIWAGSSPVEFESSFGLTESVQRLKAATRRWALFNVSQEAAAGTVTQSRVSLQRVIPMVGNSFKPFFTGRFQESHGKIILSGRFTLHWLVKIFLGFWFGFCVLFTALAAFAAIRSQQVAAMPLAGIVMLALGLGIVRIGGWFSRNDPAWLSDVIRHALSTPMVAPPVGSGMGSNVAQLGKPSTSGPPKVILVVTAVLALLGVMSFASAITGIQSYQGSATGSVVTHYANDGLRYGVAAYGLLMLALSYGIYRRRLLAWRMGFAILIVGVAIQALTLATSNDLGQARASALFFCVASAFFTIIWGRWWYAQRIHFHD
ncbi:hypothetical protein [Dyella tabacisoli]|uniref:Uncharacterized protein n=1 Tax=Dyella tabacisoli TaxID=2282381 RepID=A0A369UNQ3_9GAMM|nr:hypothetical protein [Dyella tabacisoli]RDD82276.1 hypothetical protein DVJ77_07590 [Dyella tabacisoli]